MVQIVVRTGAQISRKGGGSSAGSNDGSHGTSKPSIGVILEVGDGSNDDESIIEQKNSGDLLSNEIMTCDNIKLSDDLCKQRIQDQGCTI